MRHTDFWERMNAQFGARYAASVARDQVIGGLDGRTAEQALAEGVDPKRVWLAVCDHYELPVAIRH